MLLQDLEGCSDVLTKALEAAPLSVPLLVALAAQLLDQEQIDASAHLARRALKVNPRARPAWLLLARCFVLQRQYAHALVALNVVPTPPLPQEELELLFVVPPPVPKRVTQPQVRPQGCVTI